MQAQRITDYLPPDRETYRPLSEMKNEQQQRQAEREQEQHHVTREMRDDAGNAYKSSKISREIEHQQ